MKPPENLEPVDLFLCNQRFPNLSGATNADYVFADVVVGMGSAHGYVTRGNEPPTDPKVKRIFLPGEVSSNLQSFYEEFHANQNPKNTDFNSHTTALFLAGCTKEQQPLEDLNNFNLSAHAPHDPTEPGSIYAFVRTTERPHLIRHCAIGAGSLVISTLGKEGPLICTDNDSLASILNTTRMIKLIPKG